jgi:hypothetical protein
MPTLAKATPTQRKHKASGQAIVTIEGRDFYLGPRRTAASKTEYDRIIGEWLAAGRKLPVPISEASDLTVVGVLARFEKHALKHYQKDGKPTGEWEDFRHAFVRLMRLYGRTTAHETPRVRPFSHEIVDQTMAYLPPLWQTWFALSV